MEVSEEKDEKAGAGTKMGEAEKLKERETAADKQQHTLVWKNLKKNIKYFQMPRSLRARKNERFYMDCSLPPSQ